MNVILSKSSRKEKKYQVVINDSKTIHFGASGYSDFTLHKDTERRNRYDRRHKPNEDWSDPMTAGFWAKWVLWNKPTITGSVNDINKRFDLRVKISK